MRSQPFNGSFDFRSIGPPKPLKKRSAGEGSPYVHGLFVIVYHSRGRHGPGVAAWDRVVCFSVAVGHVAALVLSACAVSDILVVLLIKNH